MSTEFSHDGDGVYHTGLDHETGSTRSRAAAHGLLYSPGDVGDLAAKVEMSLADPAATAARVRRGYEYATRTFTRDGYGGAVFRKAASLVGAANPTTPAWPAALLDALVQASATGLPE